MRRLMELINKHFRLLPNGEYSIEVDPRKVDRETVKLLAELGFNRMSVGVQDFEPSVQVAVNRVQTLDETRVVIDAAREFGFKSISVDLIYGLPKQNVISFNHTLDEVIKLSPDRLSIYNYAHLPGHFKPQRRIHEAELPSADAKLQILQTAIRRLTDAGYVFIGMDHFAKPDDELAVAQRQGRLHRNFQGYSTHAEADLLAFGVSAISKVGPTYCQNFRTLDEYYDALDSDVLPVMRGLELTADDLLRRSIIQALMCHFELSLESIEIAHLIDFKSYFAAELADLQADGAGRAAADRGPLDQRAAQGAHAGARHRHGLRPLPARRPRAGALLQGHLAFVRTPVSSRSSWSVLLGGTHCVGMCGGIVGALAVQGAAGPAGLAAPSRLQHRPHRSATRWPARWSAPSAVSAWRSARLPPCSWASMSSPT